MKSSRDTDHKGCVVSQGQQPQSQAVEDVYHPRHPRIFTKRHSTLPVFIYHSLVVNQPDILKVNQNSRLLYLNSSQWSWNHIVKI